MCEPRRRLPRRAKPKGEAIELLADKSIGRLLRYVLWAFGPIMKGLIPIILMLFLITGSIPTAAAYHTGSHKVHWALWEYPNGYVFGVRADLKPEIDAVEYHPDQADSRISDWITILDNSTSTLKWIQTGWYKGRQVDTDPTGCPAEQNVMRIYVELHSAHDDKDCYQHSQGSHAVNVVKTYLLQQEGFAGSDYWWWRASVNGWTDVISIVKMQSGWANLGMESHTDPNINQGKVLHTSIQKRDSAGSWADWNNHVPYCKVRSQAGGILPAEAYKTTGVSGHTQMRAEWATPPITCS